MSPQETDILNAHRRLFGWHEGVLNIDGEFRTCRFIIDPASGNPAAPVHASVFQAPSLVLHIPEDEPEAVHLTLRAVEVDPRNSEAADRWSAYFGPHPEGRFGILEIESFKRLDSVLDGELARPLHPFRHAEGRLCKAMNQDRAALADACERLRGTRPELRPDSPLCVGVDPFGLDLRIAFGVTRLDFPSIAATEAEAVSLCHTLLGVRP